MLLKERKAPTARLPLAFRGGRQLYNIIMYPLHSEGPATSERNNILKRSHFCKQIIVHVCDRPKTAPRATCLNEKDSLLLPGKARSQSNFNVPKEENVIF